MKPDSIPTAVIDAMASAMLDPALRTRDGTLTPPLPAGNAIRAKVLLRALEEAQNLGWELVYKKSGK